LKVLYGVSILKIRVETIQRKVKGGMVGGSFLENLFLNPVHFLDYVFVDTLLFQLGGELSQELLCKRLGLERR
jgi:hypothetical protein